MTISNTKNTVIYPGNGLANTFGFGFIVPNASQLNVYYTDANGNITLLSPSQYGVTGIGNPNGGTVTYPLSGSPIAGGTSITLARIVTPVQMTDVINQSGYYPDVIEAALDYLTMLAQQLSTQVGASLQLPISVQNVSTVLPIPQALSLIGWNSAGTGLQNFAGSSSAPVSAAMAPVVSAATISAALSALGASATGTDTTYCFRANNLSDLTNAAVARQNLGIGNGGTVNTANNAVVLNSTGQLPAVSGALLTGINNVQFNTNQFLGGTYGC